MSSTRAENEAIWDFLIRLLAAQLGFLFSY